MVHHLAIRMRNFHTLGYVHRDLKPGNVMWLPRENRWTVIDFGCAARTGEQARLGFSLAYAAPEVISAYRVGAHSMVVQVRTASSVLAGIQDVRAHACLSLHSMPCHTQRTAGRIAHD